MHGSAAQIRLSVNYLIKDPWAEAIEVQARYTHYVSLTKLMHYSRRKKYKILQFIFLLFVFSLWSLLLLLLINIT